MERNEDSGFAALILIETSLAASYKSAFSDSFGCFLRSLSDRVCMSVVAWVRAGRWSPWTSYCGKAIDRTSHEWGYLTKRKTGTLRGIRKAARG